jgi:hypothetical protein
VLSFLWGKVHTALHSTLCRQLDQKHEVWRAARARPTALQALLCALL